MPTLNELLSNFRSRNRAAEGSESFWFGLAYSILAGGAAIGIPLALWWSLRSTDSVANVPIKLTLVAIAGVIGLLTVLMIAALAFSSVKLSDHTQPLGLPEGSVRAVIALSLIVIFVITVLFLYSGLGDASRTVKLEHLSAEQAGAIPGNQLVSKTEEDKELFAAARQLRLKAGAIADTAAAEKAAAAAAATEAESRVRYTVERMLEPSRSSEDFAKQVITTISTLVVSISAFYFGSSTAISAATKAGGVLTENTSPTSGLPVITAQPEDHREVAVNERASFEVTATGDNLTYQWQRIEKEAAEESAKDIEGATARTYEIKNVSSADDGARFLCKVANAAGTVSSKLATLTLKA